MKKYISQLFPYFLPTALFLFPMISFAAGLSSSCRVPLTSLTAVLTVLTCLLSLIIPIFFFLALIFFSWGVAQFVIYSNDTEEHIKGKKFMIWGLIAIFLMVSLYGVTNVLAITFGFNHVIPQLK